MLSAFIEAGGVEAITVAGIWPGRAPLDGTWSARVMRDWRVPYEIDEEKHEVLVVDIRHRADAYRRR